MYCYSYKLWGCNIMGWIYSTNTSKLSIKQMIADIATENITILLENLLKMISLLCKLY